MRSETASRTCGIAVMAKASIPGQTKTRLVPPLSFDEAARCNTAFLRDAADTVLAASKKAAITGYMAFSPAQTKSFFQDNLPSEIGLIEAWYPNLGDCLLSAIAHMLDGGHDSAVVLNSDSPTLPVALLLEAVEVLLPAGDRIVLGPATDGGYYLLGVKRKHRHLFQNIAWSTERVARQTLDRAAELSLPVHVLPEWYDVDDIGGLDILQRELFDERSFARDIPSGAAPHTRAFLQTVAAKLDLQRRPAVADAFGKAGG
jgi:rSAM/selenodomain-associated transferase 1